MLRTVPGRSKRSKNPSHPYLPGRSVLRRLAAAVACLALGALSAGVPSALATSPSFSTTLVASGFTQPDYVTNAGDSRLFVVEQTGVIKIIHGDDSVTTFLDLSSLVLDSGEQGLLGLAFHPDYASNGLFYVYYTPSAGGAEVLAEFHRSAGDPDVADPNSERILLNLPDPYGNHNGGWLAFKGQYLYISTGDGGSGGDPQNRAQTLSRWWGKILRINPLDPAGPGQYSIPSNNPYVGRSGRDEIWSYGLRNPWRCSFDTQTGRLWCGDVGQDAYEEIDRSRTGRAVNFGWHKLEGRHYYAWSGHTRGDLCTSNCKRLPILEYPHDDIGNGGRCAVTGGYVSRRAGAALFGNYVFGDFCSGEIWVIPAGFTGSTPLPAPTVDTSYNISSFGQGADGRLYVVDLNGAVYRIDQS